MASLASLQKRYQRGLDTRDFYAAEQACRMMHHRLTHAKSATEADRANAVSVVLAGAAKLLAASQVQAGTALALLATKHYVEHATPVSDAATAALETVAAAYDESGAPLADEARRERLRFLRAALAWSARRDCAGFAHGHARLNRLTAHAAVAAAEPELAQRLFVHAADPAGAADALAACPRAALASERPLVLARMVLRMLLSENIADADAFRARFAELQGWPAAETAAATAGGAVAPPLANFCEIVVKLCQLEARAGALFERVCASYRAELQRDPSFDGMLVKLGAMYFNIAPPQPGGMAGMMGNLLRGMMHT